MSKFENKTPLPTSLKERQQWVTRLFKAEIGGSKDANN